jgi:class 3 adenylate cyclase/DNA-binding CsgD family transcriptional regulator/predicted negative regulator of RcsB-dependent stress response
MVRRSIVFTDIVGSTTLVETVGDERWTATLAEVDLTVAQIAARRHGRIVKGLGDGHMLAFADSDGALAFAEELLATTSSISMLERPIDLRIGVHVGDVVESEGDIHGRTVHVAARIGALASGGEVLCSGDVCAEVHDLPYSFGSARPTALRGLDGLYDLHPLLRADGQPRSEAIAAPPRGMLDRGRECAQLDALVERAGSSRGGFGMIEATAGMGKSALARFAAERATAIGTRVLSARGDELEMNYPFGIVVQLLSAASALEPETIFEGDARFSAAVLSGATTSNTSSDGHRERHALLALCVRLARQQPTIVLVDDAHWADISSLEWLAQLVRRLVGEPLCVIVAARPVQSGERGELLGRLRGEAGVEHISVRPLSDAGVRAVVQARVGPASDEFVSACVAATGGNPFLISELLRSLDNDVDAQGTSEVTLRSSAGLARVVLARLAPLGPKVQSLAAAVSVLPSGSPLRHAARLVQLDPDSAAEAADALTIAGILADRRPIEFIHALTRQAIYDELAPARRNALHRAAIDVLLAEDAPPRDIAAHAMHVEPANDSAVAKALASAGQQARSVGALDSAVAFLRRAVAEPPEAPQKDATRLALGEVEFMSGSYRAGVDVLGPLVDDRPADDRLRLSAIHVLTECYGYGLHQWADAAQVINIELDQRDDSSSDAYLWLESRRYFYGATQAEGTIDHARLATATERITTPGPGAAALLNQFADSLLVQGQSPAHEIAAVMLRALEYDPEIAYISVLTDVERPDLAVPILRDRLARAVQDGSRPAQALNLRMLGEAQWALGSLDAAGEHMQQAHDLTAGRNAIAAVWLATLMFEQGRVDDCTALLDDLGLSASAELAAAALGNAVMSSPLWHLRARLAMNAGDLDSSADEFARARRDLQWSARVQDDRHYELLMRVGRRDDARREIATIVESAERFAAPSRLGLALSAESRCIQDASEAVSRSDQALSHLRSGPDGAALAEGLANHGEALRRAQQLVRSRAVLAEAHELALACGAHQLAERINAEQRLAGARPRRVALSGVDSLTASERRVADLAVTGASNSEIAGELVLSIRTVEMHLSRVYRKLGVTGRRDLSAALEN